MSEKSRSIKSYIAGVTKPGTPAAPDGPGMPKCVAGVTTFGTPATVKKLVVTFPDSFWSTQKKAMDYQLIVHNFYIIWDILSGISIKYNFAFRMNLPGFIYRYRRDIGIIHIASIPPFPDK